MDIKVLKTILDEFEITKYNYTIWIVANVSETVQNREDFIRHTNFSEFFTKAEFASIASSITGIFGYVRIFYSEIEFISYVLESKTKIDVKSTIIYNFARDGIVNGKKSLIPAFCDLFGLSYTGSPSFVISLLRNKYVYTQFLESMGIKVPLTYKYNKKSDLILGAFQEADIIIAKSVFESASIGLSEKNLIEFHTDNIINSLDMLCDNMATDQILVQKYIEGIECEVFVIKHLNHYYAFPPVKLNIHNSKIITHTISDSFDYSFSPLVNSISENICKKIKKTTEKAAELLGVDTYARFDFRISASGDFFLIDIAGTPYLTRHSSVAYLFTEILKLQYSDIFSLLAILTQAKPLPRGEL